MADPGRTAVTHDLPGALEFAQSPLGGQVVRLVSGGSEATVALFGGQVLTWTPAGGPPVLYLSPLARLDAGKAVRGGIPVCWPWFADHPHDRSAPAHGYVRTRPWTPVETSRTGSAARIVLEAPAEASDPSLLRARLTVTLDDGLELALATTNPTSAPIVLTEALHTYFAVSDIAQVEVNGLDGAHYLDKLDGFARKRQSGPIAVDREVDRIYESGAVVCILDHGHRRRVAVDNRGSSTATVVWNPWIAKAARLADMPDDAYRRFVCIETAHAATNVATVPPGGSSELRTRLTVTPL